MAKDKFSALWISHSRIKDFEICPRAYYLKYLHRAPKTGHRIKLMTPPLALGQIVHDVLETLSVKPLKERFKESLIVKLHTLWNKIEGKRGGFPDSDIEQQYKARAETMLLRIMKDPGPLAKLAVKMKMDLPYFWLSEEKNIIISGKIDWMEYLPERDAVRIIDFKTTKNEESPDSLQLPIYYLLAKECQTRFVEAISYWYLEREEGLSDQTIPNIQTIRAKLLQKGEEIRLATQLSRFKCREKEGCSACRPYELILKGEAEFVGINSYREDIYVLDTASYQEQRESEIL